MPCPRLAEAMPGLTRIWFARHGEVEADLVGRFVGAGTDVRLSDTGRHQAEAIAAYLENGRIDTVVASPMRRALDTAAPLAKAHGLDVDIRPGFREMEFGDWEGRSWQDIEQGDPEYAATWQADPGDNPCPGGETANGFCARAQDALAEVLEEHAGRNIALFGHAGTCRAVLAQVTGRPYLEAFTFAQDYGCLNAAAWDVETRFGQVALVNFVPGPRSTDNGDGGRRVPESEAPHEAVTEPSG